MTIKTLQENYGIAAKQVTSLRNNVAIVETEEKGKTILKTIRKTKTGNLINKFRFNNELRIYKALQSSKFDHLHTPELIQCSNRHMVLQYVEKMPGQKPKIQDFVRSYYEMQTLAVPQNRWFDFLNQLVRGLVYKGLAVPLFILTKHIGIANVGRVMGLFLKMHLTRQKTKNRYWLHGDLTSHNIYYNVEDGKLYFLDFENLFYTRKWPLLEIAQRCFWLQDGGYGFTVDPTYLKLYLDMARKKGRNELLQLDFKKQFRFSMLMVCISNMAIAKGKVKRDSFKMLLKTVLDKKTFEAWFAAHFQDYMA